MSDKDAVGYLPPQSRVDFGLDMVSFSENEQKRMTLIEPGIIDLYKFQEKLSVPVRFPVNILTSGEARR